MRGIFACKVAVVAGLAMVCGRGIAQASSPETWPGAIPVPWREKVLLVTVGSPEKKQVCRAPSLSEDKIVCGRHGARKIAYRRSEIAAIITPADRSHWPLWFVGFLGGSGAAFWGSVVLAPVCIPCSVSLAITGTLFFLIAPATAMGADGDHPETVLYRKPGETLQVKLQ